MTEAPASRYEPIAVGPESTVVAKYIPEPIIAEGYQSEAELEREFIGRLESQGYEYLRITSESQLVANLRAQLEELNGITFSDAEWGRFFTARVAGANDTAEDKTRRIQEDPVQLLTRDDGSTQNVKLIDKTHIHNNRLQVINQYEIAQGDGGAARSNRYDVTVLVNGLPLVHIELKRRGVDTLAHQLRLTPSSGECVAGSARTEGGALTIGTGSGLVCPGSAALWTR